MLRTVLGVLHILFGLMPIIYICNRCFQHSHVMEEVKRDLSHAANNLQS